MQASDGARSANGPLFRDPPLLDRLTWREGIRPETLISRDRGLIARTLGSLAALGGLFTLAISLLSERSSGDDAAFAAIAGGAFVLAAICFVFYRRLTVGFFHGMLIAGTLLISGAVAAAAPGAEGVYGFFYAWIVFAAFLFFPVRAATAQAAFAAVSFAAVLELSDAPFTLALVLSAIATLGGAAAIIGILMTRLESVATGLAAQAHTDPVTASANRREFDQRIGLEIERTRRNRRPLSLVLCDLDRFKGVNDALGHNEGDVALRRAAGAIASAVRAVDAVARLGGEEFGVILPETDRARSAQVAERIRVAVSEEFSSYAFPLTASCGVACTEDVEATAEALFSAADGALYLAKREGRNKVVAHPVAAPSPGAAPAWSGAD